MLMRQRTILLLGALAFLLGVHSAQSAGISTHIEVADRAALEVDASAYAELSGVVQAWPVALRSGSIYPDWGYLLEEYSAAAEDAHWGPFRKLAMDYHRTAYPQPWSSPHAERVLAFFMGIGVHGRTDDVWHFGNNAFLPEAMANDLVDVDPEQAELVIEVLVDFFTQQDHRPNSEKTRLWVPLNDILAVHESAGHLNLSRQAIFLGTSAQSVAYFLEDLLWPYIAPLGALITPWSRANYLAWPNGGVEDSASRSARAMERLWDHRMSGTTQSSGGHPSQQLQQAKLQHNNQKLLSIARDLLESGAIDASWKEDAHGAIHFTTPVVHRWDLVWMALDPIVELLGESKR